VSKQIFLSFILACLVTTGKPQEPRRAKE